MSKDISTSPAPSKIHETCEKLKSAIDRKLAGCDNESSVNKHLEGFIYRGLAPYCEEGPILTLRRQIQDDPLVVHELALRLK